VSKSRIIIFGRRIVCEHTAPNEPGLSSPVTTRRGQMLGPSCVVHYVPPLSPYTATLSLSQEDSASGFCFSCLQPFMPFLFLHQDPFLYFHGYIRVSRRQRVLLEPSISFSLERLTEASSGLFFLTHSRTYSLADVLLPSRRRSRATQKFRAVWFFFLLHGSSFRGLLSLPFFLR